MSSLFNCSKKYIYTRYYGQVIILIIGENKNFKFKFYAL